MVWLEESPHKRRDSALTQLLDLALVLLNDHEGEPILQEGFTDDATHSAIPAHECVIAQPMVVRTCWQRRRYLGLWLEDGHEPRVGPQPRLGGIDGTEEQRVEGDRDERAGEDQVIALVRQQAETTASSARMNENSPIWASPAATSARPAADSRRSTTMAKAASACRPRRQRRPRATRRGSRQERRVEQHADRDEEQDRERVAQRAAHPRRPGG